MPEKRPESSKDKSRLTRDIQAFVRQRTANKEVKAVAARKHIEIQLLLSELENLLLNLSKSDPGVTAARKKLRDLKHLVTQTLDLE